MAGQRTHAANFCQNLQPRPSATGAPHGMPLATGVVGPVQPAVPPAQPHSLINNSKQQLDNQTQTTQEHTQLSATGLPCQHHATLALPQCGKAPTSFSSGHARPRQHDNQAPPVATQQGPYFFPVPGAAPGRGPVVTGTTGSTCEMMAAAGAPPPAPVLGPAAAGAAVAAVVVLPAPAAAGLDLTVQPSAKLAPAG